MTSTALRLYTAVIALVCAVSVVMALHAQSMASGWQSDSRAWQTLVGSTVAHDRAATLAEHRLAVRYDRLVRRTTRSQRRMLAALKRAQSGAATPQQATVYQTVPSAAAPASAPAAAPAPVAVSAPAPPTTRTS
jgi:hypothetical protein